MSRSQVHNTVTRTAGVAVSQVAANLTLGGSGIPRAALSNVGGLGAGPGQTDSSEVTAPDSGAGTTTVMPMIWGRDEWGDPARKWTSRS